MSRRLLFAGIIWLGLALPLAVYAQPAMPMQELGQATLYDKANTAGQEAYLTESEKTVILLINIARLDGRYFVEHYLPLYKDTTAPAAKNLRARLLGQASTPALLPMYGLGRSSALQATEMGALGRTGTAMADGTPYQDRIHRQMPGAAAYASAYYIGSGDPLELVLGLLVGEKDTSLTYQRMLLSPKLDVAGVAVRPHKLNCSNTVIDMARRVQLTGTSAQAKKHKEKEAYFKDCPQGAKVARTRRPKQNKLLGWLF